MSNGATISIDRAIVRTCMSVDLAGAARRYAEAHAEEYAAFLERWRADHPEWDADTETNGAARRVEV